MTTKSRAFRMLADLSYHHLPRTSDLPGSEGPSRRRAVLPEALEARYESSTRLEIIDLRCLGNYGDVFAAATDQIAPR